MANTAEVASHIVRPARSAGIQSPSGTFTPAVAASAYDVSYLSIWDASVAGNCIGVAALQAVRTIDNSNPLVIAIGDIIEALS